MLLLGALQALCLVWFAMIVRVAAKVVAGKGADDSRSDDEGEDEEGKEEHGDVYFEDEEVEVKRAVPVFLQQDKRRAVVSSPTYARGERQVASGGGTGTGTNVRRRPSPITSSSGSSKISRRKPGAGGAASLADRKDLLGRIGCDKPT